MFWFLKSSPENTFYVFFILQIILESLPISSSGHIQIFQNYCNFNFQNYKLDFLNDLAYLPTFIIVFIFFLKDWIEILKFSFSSLKNFLKVFFYFFIVEGITVLFYLIFDYFKFYISVPLGFLMTGIFLLFSCFCLSRKKQINFSSKEAVLLGFTQGVSLLPGVSRLGITYSVCKMLGYSNRLSLVISFMILMPLALGLSIRGLIKGFAGDQIIYFFDLQKIFILLIASFISFVLLFFVKKVFEKNYTWIFSLYLILASLFCFVFMR